MIRNADKYYDFIVDFQKNNDRSPTMSEIAKHFDVQKSYVFKVIAQLVKSGKLKRGGRIICMVRSEYCKC